MICFAFYCIKNIAIDWHLIRGWDAVKPIFKLIIMFCKKRLVLISFMFILIGNKISFWSHLVIYKFEKNKLIICIINLSSNFIEQKVDKPAK